ncbi:hypothetical protein [Sphingomicrobium marinum]|uniref:hypothetical protein n=1 Tax=Sphingomicrobium marinum TaxID=1227950 RepID=UPI0022409FC8|nr:hypothetical protein [Sphingomicrobium marinum]
MKKLSFAMMGSVALTLAACSGTEEAAEEAMENDVAAEDILDNAIEASNEVLEEVVEEAEPAAPPPIAEEDLTVEDQGTEDVPGM